MAFSKIEKSEVDLEERLAQGGFGTVYKGFWKKASGNHQVIAAKRVEKKEAERELKFLSELVHPNIVKLLGVIDNKFEVDIILEFCDGGSLRSFLTEHRGKHLGGQFFIWAKQAGKPIEYLKEMGVVHKDIKSPNYLITGDNIIKLCDFGLAKSLDTTMTSATDRASYAWMAPELLKDNVLSPTYDIFSFGIVVWELWTTDVPFEDCEPANLIWRICHENQRPGIPPKCPKLIADLMRLCWETDWKKRPSMGQVLSMLNEAEQLHHKELERNTKPERQTTMRDIAMDENSNTKQAPRQQEPMKSVTSTEPAVPPTVPSQTMTTLQYHECVDAPLAISEAFGGTASSVRPSAQWYTDGTMGQNTSVGSTGTLRTDSSYSTVELQSEKQRQFLAGPWKLENEFGYHKGPRKLISTEGIAVCPDGRIAVLDYKKDTVHVFSHFSDHAEYQQLNIEEGMDRGMKPSAWSVAVSKDGIFYVASNHYVLMYSVQGKYQEKWVAMSPSSQPSNNAGTWLHGLTIDNDEHLIVGQVGVGHDRCMYISRHRVDGSHVASFKVSIAPYYLAVSSQDNIVISDSWASRRVQIVDSGCRVLHTLNLDNQLPFWNPAGVVCYNDTVLVCNSDTETASEIACFSVSKAEYLGSIPVRRRPFSLTIRADNSKLLIACLDKVQVYTNQSLLR